MFSPMQKYQPIAAVYWAVAWIVAALLLSTTATAKDDSLAIRLNYNWPTGLAGQMQIAINRTTIQNNDKQVLSMNGSARLLTSSHPQGLLVSLSDVDYALSDSDQSRGEFMREVMAEMASLDMTLLISAEGELIDVIGFEESAEGIRQRVNTLFEKMGEQIEIAPAIVQTVLDMLETVLSEEQLEQSATANWNRDVNQWQGMQLVPGVDHQVEFKTQSPLFPEKTLDSIGIYNTVGKVPCNKEDIESHCVELSYQSELTAQSKALFKDFLHKLLVDMGQGEEEIDKDLIDIKIDSTLNIVTEPATLVPHSINELQSVFIDMGPARGKQRTINQTSIQYEFD